MHFIMYIMYQGSGVSLFCPFFEGLSFSHPYFYFSSDKFYTSQNLPLRNFSRIPYFFYYNYTPQPFHDKIVVFSNHSNFEIFPKPIEFYQKFSHPLKYFLVVVVTVFINFEK